MAIWADYDDMAICGMMPGDMGGDMGGFGNTANIFYAEDESSSDEDSDDSNTVTMGNIQSFKHRSFRLE